MLMIRFEALASSSIRSDGSASIAALVITGMAGLEGWYSGCIGRGVASWTNLDLRSAFLAALLTVQTGEERPIE